MRKLFTILCAVCFFIANAVFLNSCSQEPELGNDLGYVDPDGLLTRSVIGDLLYDPETEFWYEDSWDPYRIENMTEALNRLMENPPSNWESLGAAPRSIQITHLVLRVKPKTPEEMDELSQISGVEYSDISPDWIQAEDQTGSTVGFERETVYGERYYYIDENDDLEEYEDIEPEIYMMPVIYAVWPCDTEIPDGTDYELLYDVHLPSDEDSPWMEYIEQESMKGLYGDTMGNSTVGYRSGTIEVWDKLLNDYIPVPNVILIGKIGSKKWMTTTN